MLSDYNVGPLIIRIEEGDITEFKGDAIVNAANPSLLGGGGVDGAIHHAAGAELLSSCLNISEVSQGVRCPTGEARVTDAFNLPSKKVIHTVGPVFSDSSESAPLLKRAYRSSLQLALMHKLTTVAFPAISCGVYGYPMREAAEIAITEVRDFVREIEVEMDITFVLFSTRDYLLWVEVADILLKRLDG